MFAFIFLQRAEIESFNLSFKAIVNYISISLGSMAPGGISPGMNLRLRGCLLGAVLLGGAGFWTRE